MSADYDIIRAVLVSGDGIEDDRIRDALAALDRLDAAAKIAGLFQAALKEICLTDWKDISGETPFRFEQRIHGIAALALAAAKEGKGI